MADNEWDATVNATEPGFDLDAFVDAAADDVFMETKETVVGEAMRSHDSTEGAENGPDRGRTASTKMMEDMVKSIQGMSAQPADGNLFYAETPGAGALAKDEVTQVEGLHNKNNWLGVLGEMIRESKCVPCNLACRLVCGALIRRTYAGSCVYPPLVACSCVSCWGVLRVA